MSETLEPRQVEKPYLGRWVVTALALLVRSPASFGATVMLLAVLELLTRRVTTGHYGGVMQ